MSTKWFTAFAPDRPNPFPGPYDAYITYMNVLADLQMRVAAAEAEKELEAGPAAPRKAPAGAAATARRPAAKKAPAKKAPATAAAKKAPGTGKAGAGRTKAPAPARKTGEKKN